MRPLIYFAMNLMSAPGIMVCSSFLISVCMFFVSKALLIIEYYSDCSRRGSHLVEPFTTVLFTVCSALPVECCSCNCVAWVFGMFAVM